MVGKVLVDLIGYVQIGRYVSFMEESFSIYLGTVPGDIGIVPNNTNNTLCI